MSKLFQRTDILLPREEVDMNKWSVIACDQHSSEPEYWDALDNSIGEAPSTLRLMLPEAYLDRDAQEEAQIIRAAMHSYLEHDLFRCLKDSYVYVERTLANGQVRRGLVGALKLSEYDYSPASASPIRATEGTVEDRLPPRVAIRSICELEMPHVMVFVNDPEDLLFGKTLAFMEGKTVYDFDLNAGGGHIRGTSIQGASADAVDHALDLLEEQAAEKFAGKAPVVFAIGDGNHSLATAKKCGDEYALVELVNIHDPSIVFEPIHRVVFGTDPAEFISRFGSSVAHFAPLESYAATVAACEKFCVEYIAEHGGKIDYIHNDDTAVSMGSEPGCFALLLPALKKDELFASIVHDGVFPKKSFSIGHAEDKRYYLECRKIH